MDKKEYMNRINEIKASDDLKKRIIERVNEGEAVKNRDNKIVKLFAGMAAVASVAVVALVIGINTGNRNDAPGNTDKTTSQIETDSSTVKPTVKPTEKNREFVDNRNLTEKLILESIEPDYVDENNFSLQIKITNTSDARVTINPEFWVQSPEENMKKGLSYMTVAPQETIDFGQGDISIDAGETKMINITKEFMKGYKNLLASDREAIVNFDAEADFGAGVEKGTLSTVVYISNKLDMTIPKTYISTIGNTEGTVDVQFKNLTPGVYSFTAVCTIQKFDVDTLDMKNVNDKVSPYEMTLAKDTSQTVSLDLPRENDKLVPGIYYVYADIKNPAGDIIANKRTSFVVLADGEEQNVGKIETDKDEYTYGDDIIVRFTGNTGNNWKYASYTLYRAETDGTVGEIAASGEMNINENVVEKALDITEPLAPGTYELIMMIDDGNEVKVGVGTMKTNQAALSREITIR